MFKIGEFSRLTQVSVRMLRYYDENGLLAPAEVDTFTGYRLYSCEQISRLNKIIFLRDLGFGVAEIADALENWSDAAITQRLEARRLDIQNAIKAEEEKLARIDLAKRDISQESMDIHYNVSIKNIPAYTVFSLRRRVADYYAEGLLWQEMGVYMKAHGVPITQKTFTIYHDTDYRETDVDIEVCTEVPRLLESAEGFTFRITETVPIMASTMVQGPFSNIAGAYRAFAGWLQNHNQYRMARGSRQIVHRGPWNEANPAHHLTEIQVPLVLR